MVNLSAWEEGELVPLISAKEISQGHRQTILLVKGKLLGTEGVKGP